MSSFPMPLASLSFVILAALALLSLAPRIAPLAANRTASAPRRAVIPGFAFLTLLLIAVTIVGCHHYKSPGIGYTPQGTYNLTVTGAAQNTSRGYTMTLIVD